MRSLKIGIASILAVGFATAAHAYTPEKSLDCEIRVFDRVEKEQANGEIQLVPRILEFRKITKEASYELSKEEWGKGIIYEQLLGFTFQIYFGDKTLSGSLSEDVILLSHLQDLNGGKPTYTGTRLHKGTNYLYLQDQLTSKEASIKCEVE